MYRLSIGLTSICVYAKQYFSKKNNDRATLLKNVATAEDLDYLFNWSMILFGKQVKSFDRLLAQFTQSYHVLNQKLIWIREKCLHSRDWQLLVFYSVISFASWFFARTLLFSLFTVVRFRFWFYSFFRTFKNKNSSLETDQNLGYVFFENAIFEQVTSILEISEKKKTTYTLVPSTCSFQWICPIWCILEIVQQV